MQNSFFYATLDQSNTRVYRLGLSASYRPGRNTVYRAIDQGINFLFCYGFDGQMTGILRDVLRRDREHYVVATGAYNLVWVHPNLRRYTGEALRQLRTDLHRRVPCSRRIKRQAVLMRETGKNCTAFARKGRCAVSACLATTENSRENSPARERWTCS